MSDEMNRDFNNNNSNSYNSSNTFNLVIGVATLLIALLGATFAYFSATARSAENDVTVKSAYVSIYYDGGTEIKASNLIPATQQVALSKYQKVMEPYIPGEDESYDTNYDDYNANYDDTLVGDGGRDGYRRCVDAKGKEVCYVYQFSIESDGAEGEETEILASINVNKNEFENLSYVLYEVTLRQDENGEIIKDKFGFGIVDSYNEISRFTNVDTHPDNVDYKEVEFAYFEKPYDQLGEQGEYISTVKPVACLFGFETPGEGEEDFAIDNTNRCSKYALTNKVKHTYQLVIWLEETGYVQEEQGLTFQGTVVIEVSGGVNTNEYENGQISGTQ